MASPHSLSTTMLISEWRRLFLRERQAFHEQMADGDMPERQGVVTDDTLRQHADGSRTIVARMIDAAGLVKFAALDFDLDTVAAWGALLRARDLAKLAGLPAPLISASGGKGYHLIIPFAAPVPARKAREFLALLKSATCGSLPSEKVELRPDCDRDDKSAKGNLRLSPAFHQRSRRWGAFLDVQDPAQQPSSLEASPDHLEQASLLASATPATEEQLDAAISDLRSRGHVVSMRQHHEATIEPRLDRLAPGEHPPCISALITKGVPSEMQYNAGNLNLAAYCQSRGLSSKAAEELAIEMAQASAEHSTAKRAVGDKVGNFRSNRNPPPFRCDFARNTRAWASMFGDIFGCEACPARPEEGIRSGRPFAGPEKAADASKPFGVEKGHEGGKTSPEPSTAPADVIVMPEPVALDLIAYAWLRRQGLPNLTRVWPSYVAAAAAHVCGGSPTRAAFFAEAARRAEMAAEKAKQPFSPASAQMAERVAKAFLDRLEERVEIFRADPAQGEAAYSSALDMAEGLEGRARLKEEISSASGLPLSTPASVVASQLVKAASSVMQETMKGGPLSKQREKLFEDLRKSEHPVVPLPFPQLSGILHGGFRSGLLYCLIAPPKAGKTTFSSVIMDHAARAGHPVLYVGFEMGVGQMINAALARKTRINSFKIDTRNLSPLEQHQVEKALGDYLDVEGQHLELWEAGLTTTLADAQAWAVRAVQQYPGKTPLIVVDYLQLARLGIREIDSHQSETRRVSAIAVACKDLARATGAAVMALSSVTKSAETAATHSGELDVTAARDSLAIIHAADGVLALQSSDVLVTRKAKGDDAEEELITPWQYPVEKARKRADPSATEYARAFERAAREYPADRIRHAHARLDVLRHRGRTGSAYLYYRKALHDMEEVDLFSGIDGSDEAFHVDNEVMAVEEMMTGHVVVDTAPATSAAPKPYRLITTLEELEERLGWMKDTAGEVAAIDFETTGLDPKTSRPRLLSVARYDDVAHVVDLDAIDGGLQAMAPYFEGGAKLLAHNAVFELKFISEHAGVKDLAIDCTMIGAHVAGLEKGLSLKDVAKHFLGVDLDKDAQASDWSTPILTEAQLEYAARDAAVLLDLWPKIEAEIRSRESMQAYQLVRDAQPAIAAMELAGMPFDTKTHADLVASMEAERDQLLAALSEAMGGRRPSGNDLLAYFEEQLGGDGSKPFEKWPKTGTGKISTREDDITANVHLLPAPAQEVIRDKFLPYRTIEKRLTAFGKNLAAYVSSATGRIHPSFRLAGTITGRLSCSAPNLQQVPRDPVYRGLFKAPEGRALVIADYNAAELRVAAQLAGEKRLLDAFREGRDPHKLTASLLLGKAPEEITKAERQLAKAVNFGLLYGQGAKGLAAYALASYGVTMTEAEAAKHRDAWFREYPAFRSWQSKTRSTAERTLEVRTPGGRLRRWESGDRNAVNGFKATEAFNTPVQGGAAEAMLAAMARIARALLDASIDAALLATVHDELIVETTDRDADRVKELLEDAMREGFLEIFPKAPPTGLVEAHVGRTWAEK